MTAFRTDLARKIFLDRYARKTVDGPPLKVGQTVVFSPETGGKYPRREIGRVSGAVSSDDTVLIETPSSEYKIPRTHVDVPSELTYEEMCRRVAGAIAAVETPADRAGVESEFDNVLKDRRFVPAGRIMAGAGAQADLTLYNCYVIPSPDDSREGILETARQQFDIMSRGGGVGINVSSLRPRYDYVKGVNGRSSGVVSWADLYSIITGKVEQGGSRRGALMLILDVWHPDILEFISSKSEIGRLDNANISIGLSDDFMGAVESDSDWDLVFPDRADPDYDEFWDGDIEKWRNSGRKVVVYKTLKAREVYRAICHSAWASAEPGLFFVDRVNEESNCNYYDTIRCTNPCFAYETPLVTKSGIVTMGRRHDAFGSKDRVNVWDGGEWVEAEIIESGVKPLLKLTLSNGMSYRVTEDHEFGSDGEFVAAKDMQDRALEFMVPMIEVTEDFHRNSMIVGFMQGDGTYHKASQRWMANVGKKDADVAALFGDDLGDPYEGSEHKHRVSDEVDLLCSRLLQRIDIPNRDLEIGVVEFGTNDARSFLRGLFSANGCCHKPTYKRVSLKSVNRTLIDQVQVMLTAFGIRSFVTTNERKPVKFANGTYECSESYDLNITSEDLLRFNQFIGFIQSDKQARLDEVCDNFKRGRRLPVTVVKIEEDGVERVFDFKMAKTHSASVMGFRVHNCGEEPLPGWGVCNLGAMNLPQFVRPNESDSRFWPESLGEASDGAIARLDLVALAQSTKVGVRFLDNVIDATVYVNEENRAQQMGERRVGLGVMGLAEMLIRIGVRYGSPKSVEIVDKVFETIRDAAYAESCSLADKKGAFPRYDDALLDSGFAKRLPKSLRGRIRSTGLRNVTLLTVAPTGTTGSMMGTSTGIEPYFMFRFEQRSNLGSNIVEEPVVKEFRKETGWDSPALPDYFVKTDDLAPEDHVGIMSTAQKYIDSAISKTMNLPNDYTVEQVESFYELLYKSGCKGGTVYRDGSRDEQCLVKIEDDKPAPAPGPAVDVVRPTVTPLPEGPRDGKTISIPTHIGRCHVTLNRVDGDFFEVFISLARGGSDVDAFVGAIGRLVSLVLRLDSPVVSRERLSLVVRQLQGIASVAGGSPDGVVSLRDRTRSVPDAIAKAIRTLLDSFEEDVPVVEDSAVRAEDSGFVYTCHQCGNTGMTKASGCVECRVCGYSACG